MKARDGISKIIIACLLISGPDTWAQVPVEIFTGHQKATFDVMFFRFFKTRTQKDSPWLLFNRNRASIDYRMTGGKYLPQFGFTEAISFNRAKWKGFAPVFVVSILNGGARPKAGVQFARSKNAFTFFSWAVIELLASPNIDHFILARFIPGAGANKKLFLQAELIHSFPANRQGPFSFTQRLRTGLKWNELQGGLGVDETSTGRNNFYTTANTGLFLRYEF